ncbi:MAG: serine--tRNA ligase [Flavobacteriales bacterium]|nr:serine--tRNA ligase [Flavobacteriales bacterium]
MLEVPYIRENKEKVLAGLAKRNKDFTAQIENIIRLDDERKLLTTAINSKEAELKQISKVIGELMKAGDKEGAELQKNGVTVMKTFVKDAQEKLAVVENDLQQLLYQIPNVPNNIVPQGKTADENVEVYRWGNTPELGAHKKPHWELIEEYDLIDFELGTKITGAGFPVYKGKGARLQRALINFFLDEATAAGYREFQPPHMVNEASGYGTGQLPDKEGQMYYVGVDDLYLIPTAEVPLTNLYRDVILKESDLPVKMTGYTPCFRREAGSWGAHVRGLNRLHQFDKVEIVQLAHPDQSYAILEHMVEHVKQLLQKLGLHFRIIRLCGGDMGFTSALTYDFEAWSGAQERWLEVSSTSNFETFQANRLKCRFKNADGKMQYVHTLNGSALALPRIVASLLENNQDEHGIRIPDALVPYTGFDRITR